MIVGFADLEIFVGLPSIWFNICWEGLSCFS